MTYELWYIWRPLHSIQASSGDWGGGRGKEYIPGGMQTLRSHGFRSMLFPEIFLNFFDSFSPISNLEAMPCTSHRFDVEVK